MAGIVTGALALGVAGAVAAALLTSGPCEDLLPAAFSAPDAVADGGRVIAEVAPKVDGAALAADVVALGAELGLGPVRGATPSGSDATLLAFDDGTYVVADDDHVRILDAGLVAVASGREHVPATRVVAAGDLLAVVRSGSDGDELIARYDAELDLTACRPLQTPGDVVHVDAGLAVVGRGTDVELVRLDRGPLWDGRDVLTAPAVDGAVTGQLALVASRNEVVAFDRRTGDQVWRVTAGELGGRPLTDEPLLLAGDDAVFVATQHRLARVDGGSGVVQTLMPVDAPAFGAVQTEQGVVVTAGRTLLRFTSEAMNVVELPRAAVGLPAARGGTVFVPTGEGLTRVDADGTVTAARGVPVTEVSVSDGYTIVAVDAGEGLLALYGPAPSVGD